MDLIQLRKFHAIKRSKMHQIPDSFLLYMMLLTCSLFCSTPFWFPYLFSCTKLSLVVSLPKFSSVFLSPKFIFIIGNLIIILLIGESKFFASNSLPAASDVYYNEYINRKRGLQASSTLLEKKEREGEILFKENASKTCEGGKIEVKVWDEGKLEVENERGDLDGEDEPSLPAEELNKRADDFIARVNRQRRLEARLLLD
ncbi:hypothetical protein P3X46_030821 [Hevea brasiliensis]|uniref:DUF4408 domain-containing protein n=1 Tax=Hevea brasiliensis TaxID=3981 RepID=A0ABQ9KIC0_HEVBR|nr:uncharacterized protein LOC110671903 [Hevea brasiliensis]KAJ9140139.1 hypothetical protein P3X46_030821 [Hevea brasiliensis]